MIYCGNNSDIKTGGRLGNQCLRIMSLMGIAKRYNISWAIPHWEYAKFFENDIPQVDNFRVVKKIVEPRFDCCFDFLDAVDWTKNIDLHGFWQSPLYWNERLRFKTGYVGAMRHKYNFNTQPIAISVRKEFMNHPCYYPVPVEYYLEALKEFFPDYKNRSIFLFSDDFDLCKKHFNFDNVTFIEASDIEQLCVMSLCSDFIVSQSTFSYVGAYLADRGKVIRPIKNFDGEYAKKHDEKDFWVSSFIPFDHRKQKA